MDRTLAVLVPLMLSAWGCSDYQVHKTEDYSAGELETDTAPPESDPPERDPEPEDTGEPATEDTGHDEDPPIDVPDQPVYLHTGTTLYSWSHETGLLGLVGDFHSAAGTELEQITDIAIDGDGRFYGVTLEGLYGINGYTAEVWRIADLAMPLFGLTATSDGRLVGGGDGLYLIDDLTGAFTELVAPGRYETSGDLVGLPDGLLYWAVRGGDDLVVVDPNTGAHTTRGVIGVERIFGLGYAGESLYGFTEEGQVLQISPSTGEVVSQSALPGTWYGATTNPVLW
jgi:hypothetical protein